MSQNDFLLDSVGFWDMAGEKHLKLPGKRTIENPALIPLPGDRLSFDGEDQEFVVAYREFKFRLGSVCFVLVHVQPAHRA